MDNGHSHGPHEALAGWDLRHPRLVIYPHVPICLVFYRHALSHFVLAQVETCGPLTSISQTIYKICSDNPSSLLSESQIRGEKNLSISSAVAYNQRPIIHGTFVVLCVCWLCAIGPWQMWRAVCGHLCISRLQFVIDMLPVWKFVCSACSIFDTCCEEWGFNSSWLQDENLKSARNRSQTAVWFNIVM